MKGSTIYSVRRSIRRTPSFISICISVLIIFQVQLEKDPNFDKNPSLILQIYDKFFTTFFKLKYQFRFFTPRCFSIFLPYNMYQIEKVLLIYFYPKALRNKLFSLKAIFTIYDNRKFISSQATDSMIQYDKQLFISTKSNNALFDRQLCAFYDLYLQQYFIAFSASNKYKNIDNNLKIHKRNF